MLNMIYVMDNVRRGPLSGTNERCGGRKHPTHSPWICDIIPYIKYYIYLLYSISSSHRGRLPKTKNETYILTLFFTSSDSVSVATPATFLASNSVLETFFFPLRTARLFSYGKKWIYLRLFHYLNNIVNIQIQSSSILRFSIFFFFLWS